MITATEVPVLPSASSTMPNGCFSTMRNVLSSTASWRSTNENSRWPTLSRAAQRLSEAITSLVVTGEPSWNFSPSRSVNV